MSDTVKLIIEIPKDIYDGLMNNRGVVIPSYWHEYVADLCKNGTPLDDVKAEIKNEYYTEKEPSLYQAGTNFGLSFALEILDNIGKSEKGGE